MSNISPPGFKLKEENKQLNLATSESKKEENATANKGLAQLEIPKSSIHNSSQDSFE